MTITNDTKLSEILKEYPWLIEEAVKIDERFRILKNPVGKLFIKNSTIEGLSERAGLDTDVIIQKLYEMIENHQA